MTLAEPGGIRPSPRDAVAPDTTEVRRWQALKASFLRLVEDEGAADSWLAIDADELDPDSRRLRALLAANRARRTSARGSDAAADRGSVSARCER